MTTLQNYQTVLRPVQTLATLLANKRQHCWAQHVASICTPCCVLLRLVGSCWMKFETVQTSEPRSANISIVSRSSKRGSTMLRSFAQHTQQCCAGACAPKSGMYEIVGICVPESLVFSSEDPTYCDLLPAFAHMGLHCATRHNIVGPNNVSCFCERWHGPLQKTSTAVFHG